MFFQRRCKKISSFDQDRTDLQKKMDETMKRQTHELIDASAIWRTASEVCEFSSKMSVAIGSIVSYSAASEVSGMYSKKLAFIGGSLTAVGATLINLSTFCHKQSHERSHALAELAKRLDLRYTDITDNFSVSK